MWLPLSWALLVLLFFSLSAGKRGVYILPALPAVVLAAASYLEALSARRGVQRASLALAALLLAVVGLAVGRVELTSIVPFAVFLVAGAILWAIAWRKRPILAWPALLALLAVVWGVSIAPAINASRSGRAFIGHALARVGPHETLGLVGYREQFLLYLGRPTVNFGHRRWVEGDQEAFDASSWLAGGSDRVLLVPEKSLARCFSTARRESVGRTSRESWFLVRGAPSMECVRIGDARRAIAYRSKT